ncbi:EXT1 [Lepeophtheirus salmonis]|uniref:EXT1 n=2 Tax=Lepeophtheirus salmonis TaxID=72036 RepID=A0A7R8D6K8_LEPSM|nr:EXT1 [Lepeophtheirus salmonis]CAF2992101.1 EXT1 [Lepeophtheirus salmonis]
MSRKSLRSYSIWLKPLYLSFKSRLRILLDEIEDLKKELSLSSKSQDSGDVVEIMGEEDDDLHFKLDSTGLQGGEVKEEFLYEAKDVILSQEEESPSTPEGRKKSLPSCFNCDGVGHIISNSRRFLRYKRYHLDSNQKFAHLQPGWLKEAQVASSGVRLYAADGYDIGEVGDEEGELPGGKLEYDTNKLITWVGFNKHIENNIYIDESSYYRAPSIKDEDLISEMLLKIKPMAKKSHKRRDMQNTNTPDPVPMKRKLMDESSPTSPSTPIPNKVQKISSDAKILTEGTPIVHTFSPFQSLPTVDKWAKDTTDHILFENLPDYTGKWDKLLNVIKKGRESLSKSAPQIYNKCDLKWVMRVKKRYFLLVSFCAFLLASYWGRHRLKTGVSWKTSGRSIYDDFKLIKDYPEHPLMATLSEDCRMETCFNFTRCSVDFKVYVYPDTHSSSNPSQAYLKILHVLRSSSYFTSDPEKACLFVLSIDTLDRDPLSLTDFVRNMPARFANLPYWNGGLNHVIFNLYSGTYPDYAEDLNFDAGKAILAKASIANLNYRPGFDVSLPLFHKFHPEKGGEEGTLKSHNFPINKKHFLAFKGKRYVYGIGSETRNSLHHLHNGNELVLVTTCRHGKNWKELKDERCDEDNREFDRWDYDSLLLNSTFCLVPRGRRLGSFRFLETLQAGCVPVVLSNDWILPFSEIIDWSTAVVMADERLLLQVPEILRSIPQGRIFSMRKQTQILWNQYLKSVENIVTTTLEIINSRISRFRASRESHVWNSSPGGLVTLPSYSDVLNSFPFFDSFLHSSPLYKLIKRVSASSYTSKIVILWMSANNASSSIPSISSMSSRRQIPIHHVPVKDVSNRFMPLDLIETEAVLSLDDDSLLTTEEIDFCLWASPPGTKELVNKLKNCEDILMNFLVSSITKKSPIKVTQRKQFKYAKRDSSFTSKNECFNQRQECINHFASKGKKDKYRLDGERLKDSSVRSLFCEVGVLTKCKGSAYIERGQTKVIASVFGPREIQKKLDFSSTTGILSVEYKETAFASRDTSDNSNEKKISSKIDVFITVLENDGSAVATAITAASLALSDASINLFDLAIGFLSPNYSQLFQRLHKKRAFVDPCKKEEGIHASITDEENDGNIVIGYQPSLEQIVALLQDGIMEQTVFIVADTKLNYFRERNLAYDSRMSYRIFEREII